MVIKFSLFLYVAKTQPFQTSRHPPVPTPECSCWSRRSRRSQPEIFHSSILPDLAFQFLYLVHSSEAVSEVSEVSSASAVVERVREQTVVLRPALGRELREYNREVDLQIKQIFLKNIFSSVH